MKRDIAIAWAEMLLSNPEVQGRKRLAPDEDHRCCLGLLSDMVGVRYEEYAGCLPSRAMQLSGMKDSLGDLDRTDPKAPCLAKMNDTGTPWEEIALFIEAHSEEL